MDSGYEDVNPFFDTKPELNLIEVGSRVFEEKFGKSIKVLGLQTIRQAFKGDFGDTTSP